MSLPPRDLMLLHDGELTAEAESELLAALESDEAARAELDGLEQLGDFLREAHEVASLHAPTAGSSDRPFVSMVDSVLAALDEPALRPVPDRTPPRPTAARERGWVVAVGVTLAAAAAGVFWLRSSHSVEPASPTASLTRPAAPEVPSVPGPAVPAVEEDPVAIVSVDFGGNDGTIFVVGDESTPVVWLADDAVPAEDAKMGPL